MTYFLDETRRLREVQNLPKVTQYAWVKPEPTQFCLILDPDLLPKKAGGGQVMRMSVEGTQRGWEVPSISPLPRTISAVNG